MVAWTLAVAADEVRSSVWGIWEVELKRFGGGLYVRCKWETDRGHQDEGPDVGHFIEILVPC